MMHSHNLTHRMLGLPNDSSQVTKYLSVGARYRVLSVSYVLDESHDQRSRDAPLEFSSSGDLRLSKDFHRQHPGLRDSHRIHRERMKRELHSMMSTVDLARASLVILRFNSVGNKPGKRPSIFSGGLLFHSNSQIGAL